MSELLTLKNIGKRYGKRTLFSDFSYSFSDKGLYTFLGESGSGKSTLLEIIAGMDGNYEGVISFKGKPLSKKNEERLSDYRLSEIGFIHQGYDLLELETALSNVTLPLIATSEEDKSKINKRGEDLLTAFSLKERTKARVCTCSGGEKQRVALARAISSKTRILLCDEPTGALDSKTSVDVYRYLRKIAESMLVIFVTHDEEAAYKYADGVFLLQHERITFHEQKNEIEGEKIAALPVKKRKKEAFVPFLYWLSHAFHLCLAKKRRSALAIMILSLSLFSLGTSIFLSFDTNREIESAFSSLIGESSIVMEKEGETSSLEKAYAATEDDIDAIMAFAPNIAEGYGITYFADFRSYFPDFDTVYALSGSHKVELASFSAGTPNDFSTFEEADDLFVYPYAPEILEDDQIILGLPYKNMAQLCFGLQILRDYESLGTYLETNEVEILFEVANESWKYEDSQLFLLVGVVQSEKPMIYHTNPLWNQYFYETRMRFPTTDGSESQYPWLMQKVYYLRSLFSEEEFYKEVRLNPSFSSYLFERPNEEYNSTLCTYGSKCGLNRYYVYFVKRNSFSLSEVEEIKKRYNLPSYLLLGENSYVSFPSSLMSGFAFSFYASKEIETLSSLVESVSIVPLEAKDLSVQLPSGIKEGSYKLPFSSSLTISSSSEKLKSGRSPTLANEVALSEKLYKEWGEPTTIYCAGMIDEKERDGYVERDYRMGALKVTGVIENSNDVLFVTSSWSIDFFRNELGMSSFLLEPTQVIFETDGSNSKELIAKMKADYPSYSFIDPSSSISSSTESVIYFVRLALVFASSSSLALSFLLLVTISVLSIRENRKEGKMLFELGLARKEIVKAYFSSSLLPIAVSSVISLALVSLVEFFIHQKIAESFGGANLSFNFSFLPHVFILGASLIAAISLFLGLRWYLSTRDFHKEGR